MTRKENNGVCYWWVTASERDPNHAWHWDSFFEDYNNPKNYFDWGGPNWIRSTVSFARIKDMRKGDIVVAYQAQEGVVGLIYLASNGYPSPRGGSHNSFNLKPTPNIRLNQPVPFEVIRDSKNALADFEFIRVKRGSVFEIAPRGFETLLQLMMGFNTKQKSEIATFLKPSRTIVEAKVVAIDSLNELKSPRRRTLLTQRVIRDSGIGKSLKQLYQYKCQICGQTIELPNGERYAEVHHLRPVGAPHNGKDGAPNLIVVCPQHHAMFDLGAIAINPASLTIEHWAAQKQEKMKLLKHELSPASLNYHYKWLFKRSE